MATNKDLFSTKHELAAISQILRNYAKLPFSKSIPGEVMEGALGHVRRAEVLGKYDFVDVVDRVNPIGWQVKATKASTPVTWKRAKIPARLQLIDDSEKSLEGRQALGDAIIDFCNEHARKSMEKYDLTKIGYARLVLHDKDEAEYFERLLCTRSNPTVFNSQDFTWSWTLAKQTKTKEQLTSLHGTHKPSGKKWWAWHGRGENQLHFSGERAWWPQETPSAHATKFSLPAKNDKLSIEQFVEMLAASPNPLPKA
jgi:hypothetical protein